MPWHAFPSSSSVTFWEALPSAVSFPRALFVHDSRLSTGIAQGKRG